MAAYAVTYGGEQYAASETSLRIIPITPGAAALAGLEGEPLTDGQLLARVAILSHLPRLAWVWCDAEGRPVEAPVKH